MSAPKPRRLILTLLLAARGKPLTSREAVLACALFKIRENSVRVALVRLASAGMIEAADRGAYRLSVDAAALAGEVSSWRHAEQRLRRWSGRYMAVHCGALGRSDRTALRRRDRALKLLGFRALEAELHLRPDNLEGGVAVVRERLYTLGLERKACVFLADCFEVDAERRVRQLWDAKALGAGYARTAAKLERWLARADQLDPETQARESFLLGDEAIRQLVFDPWLPEPLIDGPARHLFVETLRRFDIAGRGIWRRLHRRLADGVVLGTPPGELAH